jgi:hypothetical protein
MRISFRRWYVILLTIWACLALPGFLLGLLWFGWSGLKIPDYTYLHFIDIVVDLIGKAFLLSPLIAAPLGIKMSNNSSSEKSGTE